MITVGISSLSNIIFSSAYTITTIGVNGNNIVCNIDGNIDEFERTNVGKFNLISSSPLKVSPAVISTVNSPSIDIQKIIQEKVMTSVAVSYGLQEGIKLWSAKITAYDDIDGLKNISDYEKACIKAYYAEYQNTVVLPKYITMIAGVAVAVWAYISPYVIAFIHAVL